MFVGCRGIPSMCLEHAINVGLAAQLDIVSSLKVVNTIALLVETSFGFNAHGSIFSLDVFSDLGDEQFSSVGGFSADCKIINLAADQHFLVVDGTRTDVPLVDNVTECHLVDQNFSD